MRVRAGPGRANPCRADASPGRAKPGQSVPSRSDCEAVIRVNPWSGWVGDKNMPIFGSKLCKLRSAKFKSINQSFAIDHQFSLNKICNQGSIISLPAKLPFPFLNFLLLAMVYNVYNLWPLFYNPLCLRCVLV